MAKSHTKKELTAFEKRVTETLINHDAVEFIQQTSDKNLFMDPKKAEKFLETAKNELEKLYIDCKVMNNS